MIILNIFSQFHRYFKVFGAFLIFITLGYIYTFGIIQSNIVSYMRNNSYSTDSVNFGRTGWIFILLLLGSSASISLGGFIEKKIGPTLTIIIGGWLASLNVILMYVTMKTYLSVVIISYGLLSGIGIGIAYGVTLGAPIKWFPKREGLILGIINSGFGISAAIFIAIQNAILKMNPDNAFDYFPLSFLIIGLIYAILQFFGAISLKYKSDIELETTEINPISCGSESNFTKLEMEPHQIIFVVDFWILWIIFCFNSICVAMITSLYHRYLRSFESKFEDDYGILTSLLYTAFNFTGELFWGFLIDKIPFKTTIIIINLTSAVFIGTLIALPIIIKPAVKYIYELWIVIISFCLSGNFPIFSYMCLKLFGIKNFITNYGMMYTATSVGGSIFNVILNIYFLNSIVNKDYYRNTFITGSVLLLTGALLTIFYRGIPRIVH